MEANPFAHQVIDNWCNPELLRAAAAEWPAQDWQHWHRYENGKLGTKDPLRLPPACSEVVRQMMLSGLPRHLGIADSFPDFNLHGGGLHAMPAGSRLGVHLDAAKHPQTGWERVASAVLFANEYWQPDWCGALELWSGDASRCVAGYMPQFNRLVIFETTDTSYHGVPDAIRCPDGMSRNTLAVFFWRRSNVRSDRTSAKFVN